MEPEVAPVAPVAPGVPVAPVAATAPAAPVLPVVPVPPVLPAPVAPVSPAPQRRHLPNRRPGDTQKARIGGHKYYWRTGEYPDGSLGEVFIDVHRSNPEYAVIMGQFAVAISIGLQYGVPLEEFVAAFVYSRFDPSGIVEGHDRLKMASSVLDLIFRDLGIEYLGRDDLAHVPAPGVPGAQPAPALTHPVVGQADQAAQARAKGYQAYPCDNPSCRAWAVIRDGKCIKCLRCGQSSGCG